MSRPNDDLWHQTRIVVIVSSSFVGSGRGLGDLHEAQCICGWAESHTGYDAACKAADEHGTEQE